jgi:hypothetical protein
MPRDATKHARIAEYDRNAPLPYPFVSKQSEAEFWADPGGVAHRHGNEGK